jgi:hypothetical protein
MYSVLCMRVSESKKLRKEGRKEGRKEIIWDL